MTEQNKIFFRVWKNFPIHYLLTISKVAVGGETGDIMTRSFN